MAQAGPQQEDGGGNAQADALPTLLRAGQGGRAVHQPRLYRRAVMNLPPIQALMMEPPQQPRSLEQFREHAMRSVEAVARTFTDPGDDWTPVLMLQNPDGAIMVAAIGPYMETEQLKDTLGYTLIPELVRRSEATMVAFITSVWTAVAPKGTTQAEAERMRAATMTNRREELHVLVATAERWEMMHARIKRGRVAAPRLGA